MSGGANPPAPVWAPDPLSWKTVMNNIINLFVIVFAKIRDALRANPWGIPVPAMVAALVVGAAVVVKFLPFVLLLGAAGVVVAVAAWNTKQADCN